MANLMNAQDDAAVPEGPSNHDRAAAWQGLDRLNQALEAAQVGAWEWDFTTGQTVWTDETWRLLGLEPRSCAPSFDAWLATVHPEDRTRVAQEWCAGTQQGESQSLAWRVAGGGEDPRWLTSRGRLVRDASGRPTHYIGVVMDVTGHKRIEHEKETLTRLLELLNAPGDLHALMRGVTALIRERFACQAVGIRLHQSNDFPYFETRGFPEEFVQRENSLCHRDSGGNPLLDDEGNPFLDCMCGNVLCGRYNPDKPFFTARGSFWSNDTSGLLATTSPADSQTHARNRCNGEGYESVGLFALRTGGVTYGLLQVNDRRRGLFSVARLELLERMADSLAVGLAQRLAAEEHKELAQQRQLALHAAQLGWWSYNPLTRTAVWDDGYRRIFGVSGHTQPNDEILVDIIHPDDLPALLTRVEAALNPADPQPYEAEYRIRRGDGGEVRWIKAYGAATFEGEGAARRAVKLIGTVEDITEHKRAEERLRESEERYRTLVETSFDWVWEVDAEGRYTSASPKSYELLGYAPEEVLGRTPFDLMPEDEARRVGEIFGQIAARREPFSALENVNRHKDGHAVVLETRGVPMFEADGRFKGYRGMDRDITARKHAEAALRRSEAHLRTLVNTLPDMVWLKNPSGVYLACNARFEMFFGASEAEIVGKTDYDFMARTVADLFRANDAAAVAAGGPRMNEEEVTFAVDGHVELLETIKTPMFDDVGCLVGVLGISRDVTARKRAELAMEAEAHRLAAVLDTQREIASANLGYEPLIQRILSCMSHLGGAEGASLEMADGDEMVYEAATGLATPFVGLRLKVEGSLSGLCMTSGELMRSSDTDTDERVDREACRRIGLRSMILMPLRYDEHSFGVLKLMSSRVAAFSSDAERPLRLMSEFLGATIARKRTEMQLREREERLQTLGDNIPGGAIYQLHRPCAGKSHYTYLGAGVERIFGLPIAGVLADPQSFWNLIVEEDRTAIDAMQERSRLELTLFDCEFRQRTVAGEIKWLHAIARPRRLTDGSTIWDGVVMDVTQRKQAEDALRFANETLEQRVVERTEALRASEERLDLAFRAAQDGVWDWNLETDEVFYSSRWKAMLGYGESEIAHNIGEWRRLLHPDDLSRAEDVVQGVLRGEREYVMEFRMRHKDGHYVDVLSRGFPIRRGASGPVIRIVGTHFDVTERKRAEEELRAHRGRLEELVRERTQELETENAERRQAEEGLRESEARFRSLIDGAPEAIFVQSGGVFLYVNLSMVSLMRAARAEDLVGRDVLDRIAPEFHDPIRDHIRLQRRAGTAVPPMELDLLCIDGSRVPVESTAVALCFQGKEGLLVFLRDITARRRAEAERASLEAQLLQAQKLESVGRLAGGVAHDFNNLLMSIMGHAELCRDLLECGHPAYSSLDEIMDAAQRSAGITRQLLAFARQQTVAPVVLNVNDHVANTLKLLQRLIGENIELTWRPGARDARVKMDPSQLDQILANLAVNARDAIAGAGRITVETKSVVFEAETCPKQDGAMPGAYVLLAVSDTGCGMDGKILAHIFEPFFTTKSVGQGTGLGLATVYGIVRQNKGLIDVQSEPGKGSTFHIYLRQQDDASVQSPAPKALPEMPRGTETILLVEDEKGVRSVTTEFLRKLGYTVLSAESPAQALRVVEDLVDPIHLLISDVVMPGMNGPELAAKLAEGRPDMKCLLISGYPDSATSRQDSPDLKGNFLAKPFTRATLARKVRDALAPETIA